MVEVWGFEGLGFFSFWVEGSNVQVQGVGWGFEV